MFKQYEDKPDRTSIEGTGNWMPIPPPGAYIKVVEVQNPEMVQVQLIDKETEKIEVSALAHANHGAVSTVAQRLINDYEEYFEKQRKVKSIVGVYYK